MRSLVRADTWIGYARWGCALSGWVVICVLAGKSVNASEGECSITITRPLAGEVLVAGTTEEITWDVLNASGDLRIEILDPANRWFFLDLGPVPVADGRIEWDVCSYLGDAANYRIRILPSQCTHQSTVSEPFEVAGSDPDPTIDITWPLDGVVLTAGSTVVITWNTTNPVGDVEVEVNGPGFSEILGPVPTASGQVEWDICATAGDSDRYEVFVTLFGCDGNSQSLSITDSKPFEIAGSTPPPTLALTSLIGGETLPAGTTHAVTWDTTNPLGNVDVQLWKDGRFERLVGRVPMADGEFGWEVCPVIGDGAFYSIHLFGSSCDGNIFSSGEAFSIVGSAPYPTMTLTVPFAGETVVAGTNRVVEWKTTNPLGNTRVFLSDGGPFLKFLDAVPMSAGRIDWPVCSLSSDGNDYSLALQPSVCGGFDQLIRGPRFSVIGSRPRPQAQLLSPLGGETLTAGGIFPVSWSVTDPVGNVGVILERGGRSLASAVAFMADEQLDWEICPFVENGDDYKVRLWTTLCGPPVLDLSGPVSVTGSMAVPDVSILNPVGGAVVLAETTQTITWDVANPIGDVTVLVMEGFNLRAVLGTVPMADKQIDWNVCAGFGDSNQYTIQLRYVGCLGVQWESAPFSVSGSLPAASISLIEPRGDETFRAGTTEVIRWDATHVEGEVALSLFRDGTIFSGGVSVPVSSQTYSWAFDPDLPTMGTYRFFASILDCGPLNARSRPFTIVAADAGDIDADGAVDGDDFRRVRECLSGPEGLSVGSCLETDVNGDHYVDLRDVMLVFRFFSSLR